MKYYSIEYSSLVKYSAIIFASSFINPIDYLDSISEELRTHILGNTYVLFDLLLSNGENSNRFAEAFFDGESIKDESLKIISLSGIELDSVNKHYRGRAEDINNSILTPSERFRYMKV